MRFQNPRADGSSTRDGAQPQRPSSARAARAKTAEQARAVYLDRLRQIEDRLSEIKLLGSASEVLRADRDRR